MDLFIQRNHKMIEGLINPNSSWNKNFDCTRELAQTIANLTQEEIQVLELIKKQLLPKCRHPKKMHDTCKGKKYCINCNMDL